jgi:hypothetical protein
MTAERLATIKALIVSIGINGGRDGFKWVQYMFTKYPELKNA